MRLPVAPAKPATGAAFIPPVLGGIFSCPFSTSLRIPIALALSTAAALWIWSWICIRRPWGKKQWGWGAFLSAQRTQRVPRAPTVQVVSLYSCKPPLSSQPNWGTRGRPKAQGKAGRALQWEEGGETDFVLAGIRSNYFTRATNTPWVSASLPPFCRQVNKALLGSK